MGDTVRPTVAQKVIEGFRSDFVSLSLIGHVIDTGFMDAGIQPLFSPVRIVGPAVTVSMPSIDTSYNRVAAGAARPGDVIVVDCGRDTRVARWGEMICFDLKTFGIEGLVIDGAISASHAIRQMEFPVFSRCLTGLVGRRLHKDGALDVTVQCGGVAVHPGDLIFGDDDGVVVIPSQVAAEVLEELKERFGQGQKESRRRWIRSGQRYADYPGRGWERGDEIEG
ncbi:MAG: RraA family protein [bacterium]